MPAYFRKEEIIHDGKRYRKYNDYLTIGGSFFNSSLRSAGQQGVGLDFHFHIRRQYFQKIFREQSYSITIWLWLQKRNR